MQSSAGSVRCVEFTVRSPNQLKSGTDAERDVISPTFLPYILTPVPESVRATLPSPCPPASSYHSISSECCCSLSLPPNKKERKRENLHWREDMSQYI
jgi:hypothetical protein